MNKSILATTKPAARRFLRFWSPVLADTDNSSLGWITLLVTWVVSGVAWLGKLQHRATQNSKDIADLTDAIKAHLDDDREMHERMAKMEVTAEHIQTDIHRIAESIDK